MKCMEKTKHNAKDVLEVVNLLLDFSNTAIIQKNFIKNFKLYTVDGRLYGHYNIGGTQSWRLSSTHPNLLNMPSSGSIYAKPVKKCFRAKDGFIFCMVDFNALEDRVIANLSKDKNKCSIFTDKLDGHCLNSYYYFKDEIEAILPRGEDEKLSEYIQRYKNAIKAGNVSLKKIRSKSKSCTFGLSYGMFPKKLSRKLKSSEDVATQIFNSYHNKLYSGITKFKNQVEKKAKKEGRIHLGLGAYLYVDNIYKSIRSVFNCATQFWAILSLITIEKVMSLVKEQGLEKDIEVVSSIYDSIYFHVRDDANIIKWLNDNLIPIMTKDYLKDIIVHNTAELECGYNWADTVAIPNNATLEQIISCQNEAKNLVDTSHDKT